MAILVVPSAHVDKVWDFCIQNNIFVEQLLSNDEQQFENFLFDDQKGCDRAARFLDMIDMPPLDHELGWFEETAEAILKSRNCSPENFHHWMRGQTVALHNGKTIIYPRDLLHYLNNGGIEAPIWD